MSTASPNNNLLKKFSRWYLCVILAMGAQILLMFWGSILGPSNGLDRIMDSVYVATSHWIGTMFFEERMFLGNAPLGLALLFLAVMLYSVVIGTVFYLVCWLKEKDY